MYLFIDSADTGSGYVVSSLLFLLIPVMILLLLPCLYPLLSAMELPATKSPADGPVDDAGLICTLSQLPTQTS